MAQISFEKDKSQYKKRWKNNNTIYVETTNMHRYSCYNEQLQRDNKYKGGEGGSRNIYLDIDLTKM